MWNTALQKSLIRSIFLYFKRLFLKISSTKFVCTVYCAYELHESLHSARESGVVEILLVSGILCYMGLNVTQDWIFKKRI